MKITIDTSLCLRNKITIDYYLSLLSLYIAKRLPKDFEKNAILANHVTYESQNFDGSYNKLQLTQEGVDLVEKLFLDSEFGGGDGKQGRFEELAEKLIGLFPRGNKPGTNNPWRGSPTMIARRLKTFAKKFGVTFTDEEAIDATKRYVNSFGQTTTRMRTLAYFIFKNEVKNGMTEEVSAFADYLANKDAGSDQQSADNDWTAILK